MSHDGIRADAFAAAEGLAFTSFGVVAIGAESVRVEDEGAAVDGVAEVDADCVSVVDP